MTPSTWRTIVALLAGGAVATIVATTISASTVEVTHLNSPAGQTLLVNWGSADLVAVGGDLTDSGTITAATALKSNTIVERQNNAGVTADGVWLKDAEAYVNKLRPSDALMSAADVDFTTPNRITLTATDGIFAAKLAPGIVLDSGGNTWATMGAGVATVAAGAWLATDTIIPTTAAAGIVVGGLNSESLWQALVGSGSDGPLSTAAGTTTLTRATYYSDLTITGTGAIETANSIVYVSGTLDLAAAPANAIRCSQAAAAAVGGAPGGLPATPTAAADLEASQGGATGGNSTATNGAAGVAAAAELHTFGGANAADGGAGGDGDTGTGGAAATGGTVTIHPLGRLQVHPFERGAYLYAGGIGGASGGGGAGDGTASWGGGAGGVGGCQVWIYARHVIVSAATAAGAIASTGGAAANGGNAPAGNRGGGGGGGGGNGGGIALFFGDISGAGTAANAVQSSGGAGGAGGAKAGAGTDGGGGYGGCGGPIVIYDLGAGTRTAVGLSGTCGGAPSGTTAGSVGVTNATL